MFDPSQKPDPENLVVVIYGDGWEGGAEGYLKDGKWCKSETGVDQFDVAITGWDYKESQ